MDWTPYIFSNFIALAPCLWLLGRHLKISKKFPDKFIPLMLWLVSDLLCIGILLIAFPAEPVHDIISVGLLYGFCIAAIPVFWHQLFKQRNS